MIKVDFLICGRRGFDVLKSFIDTFTKNAVNAVVSYADKKVLNDPFEELVSYCKEHSIAFCSRNEYKASDNIYRIAIGWQWMFDADGKTIVLHDSLLPRYRGFAPLVNCLINAEEELGVTAFLASENYDEGPIINQERITVQYPITILQAMQGITPLYTNLCCFIYKQLSNNGTVKGYEQDNSLATYSLWRDEQDYKVNWNKTSIEIKRHIDAVGYPYNGAASFLNGELVQINNVEVYPDVKIENRDIGKVIFIKDGYPIVVCKEGLLKITDATVKNTSRSIIPFSKIRSRFY